MNGSGSAGNPSAASSRRLPARTEKDTLQPADWILASEDDTRQSSESVDLSGESQETKTVTAEVDQNLKEKQRQNPPQKGQNPEENHHNPAEIQEAAKVTDQPGKTEDVQHEDPETERQGTENSTLTAQLRPEKVSAAERATDDPSLKDQKKTNPIISHQPHPFKTDSTNPDKPSPSNTEPSNPDLLCTGQRESGDPSTENSSVFISILTEQNPKKLEVEVFESRNKDQQTKTDTNPEKQSSTEHKRHQDCPASSSNSRQNTKEETKNPIEKGQISKGKCQNPAGTDMNPIEKEQREENKNPSPSLDLHTESTLAEPLQVLPFSIEAHVPRLCGFLQKRGGPLRAWRQRWFAYEEKKNQLFYYRMPTDVMPLGQVPLCSATFNFPLKAEIGTFHIQTPERTFVLKASTQELMFYWLKQLQRKRMQHRQTSNNNNAADDFLPVLESPLGLVGDQAANVSSLRTLLADMSIKHPLIHIQNSVHSLRKKSTNETSQSVFHVESPTWINPESPTAIDPSALMPVPGSRPLSLAEPAGREDDHGSRKMKNRRSFNMSVLRRDAVSSSSSRLQQEKQILLEEVKAQKELVWILHKALEASQLEKRRCVEFLGLDGEQERLELLRHSERLAAGLREQLRDAQTESEDARTSLAQRDALLSQLQDQVRTLEDRDQAKQEVIIKLSDQLTAVMSDPCRSVCSSLGSESFRRLQQENENLKDDMEAYKTQNQFLNSELYQLTRLWRTSSEQQKSLMVKCSYLEASLCQVESRYLSALRQLQDTKSLDPAQRGAVQKMIQEALKGEKLSVARDHDEYGFKIIPDYEVEDMKLLAKIQALEIRSNNLLHQDGLERPLLTRWSQYLAGRADDALCPSPELKALLRAGIPPEYRARLWKWLIQTRTASIRERHPQRYQQLCEKSVAAPHPVRRQIELDLHRTLITNQHFSSPSSPAVQQLRRVLLAFSWHSPVIGYCQGLNRLAAIALLVLQSEEDAFWCLVAVVDVILPQDYYTKDLVASQADQRVLKDFLEEKLPRLASHFEDHNIDVSLITFNWFLVLYVETLPSDILLPLWDAFLYEGTKVVFRYALALFKYKEEDILKIQDSVEIYQYLRFFTKTISDSRKLSNMAFTDMNPFPGRLLRSRRALHLEGLQGELQELELQRRELMTESHAQQTDKDLDTDDLVSEDEEDGIQTATKST